MRREDPFLLRLAQEVEQLKPRVGTVRRTRLAGMGINVII
jgi:hypothetical protein